MLALPVQSEQTAIVSWDATTAVTAPFAVVVEYWSDFFYPASDDAAVIPPNGGWMLVWEHAGEGAFEFGVARPEAEPHRARHVDPQTPA